MLERERLRRSCRRCWMEDAKGVLVAARAWIEVAGPEGVGDVAADRASEDVFGAVPAVAGLVPIAFSWSR